jgi:hypothetical protein
MTMLRTTVKKKERDMRAAMKEKEIRSVIRQVVLAESVDLAFILDATSSMASCIEGVKSSIRAIVKQIMHTNGNLTLRLGVVAYRDIKDTKRFEVLDFVTSVSEFEAFVGSLKAEGGADTPEDIAGGLQQANKLSWSNPTRIAFLIADAPCHGRDYHDGDIGDSYPDGTPGINIAHELETLFRSRTANGGGTMAVSTTLQTLTKILLPLIILTTYHCFNCRCTSAPLEVLGSRTRWYSSSTSRWACAAILALRLSSKT